MKSPALRTIKLENFKAVQNSGSIRLTPLTVFIGNNGSGKSSLIEGLITYQMIIQKSLEDAVNYWRGFDYIRNRAVSHNISPKKNIRIHEINPVQIKLSYKTYTISMAITKSDGEVLISEELINIFKSANITRDITGTVYYNNLNYREEDPDSIEKKF